MSRHAFNASLVKELRLIALLRKVVNAGDTEGARWAAMRMHRIATETMTKLGASSKLNGEWAFLTFLRDEGRATADAFLAEHGDNLGRRFTLDIEALLKDY